MTSFWKLKISKSLKNFRTKTEKKLKKNSILKFFSFSSRFTTFVYFDMTVEYVKSLVFRSDAFLTARRKSYAYLKQKILVIF